VRAEIDIFSGRPQPTWELEPSDVVEFARRLGRLSLATRAPVEPSLGYRGVTVGNLEGDQGLPTHVRAFGGVVSFEKADGRLDLQDTQDLEGWLLALARVRGHGRIVDQITGVGGSLPSGEFQRD
jgi:hypothetical protein